MNLERFIAERSPAWSELEGLCARAGPTGQRLSADELVRVGELYRTTASDLARARRSALQTAGERRLQGLVTRAHGIVYARAARDETVGSFLSRTLWRQIYAMRRYVGVAAAVMLGGLVLGVLFALNDPGAASGLLPGHVSATTHGAFYGLSVAGRGGLAIEIFTNNIVVACEAIVGGVTAGALTAYALAYNGAVLGVLGVLEWRGGGFTNFVRLVVPHGALELSCIALAGGAGFAIARAIIAPGRLARPAAVAALAPTVGVCLLGVATFLVVAGLTEGFITPWFLPTPVAVAVGVGLAGTFWALVVVRGRPSATLALDA